MKIPALGIKTILGLSFVGTCGLAGDMAQRPNVGL